MILLKGGTIVDVIRKRHPESKIVLMPIFPRNAKPDVKLRVANNRINAMLKEYPFAGKDVVWLDFNDKFLEPDGTLTKRVMNDLLHPNENGYRIWWENLGPVVKENVGK